MKDSSFGNILLVYVLMRMATAMTPQYTNVPCHNFGL